MMKRSVAMLLFLAMLACALAMPALAASGEKLTASLTPEEPKNGGKVTLSWTIADSVKEPYAYFWAGIYVYYSDDSSTAVETEDPNAGSLSVTPKNAVAVSGSVMVVGADEKVYTWDTEGRIALSNPKKIATPASGKLTVNKTRASYGDKLKASWSISGIEKPYQSYSAMWVYQFADGTQGNGSGEFVSTDDPSVTSLSFVPKEGEIALVFVNVTGADGRTFGLSKEVVLVDKVKSRKVVLAAKKAALTVGDKYDLEAKTVFEATGGTIPDEALTFTSSDTSVATVSKKGVVKALKPGKATITATAERLNQSAACKITVSAPKPTKVTLYKGSKKLADKQVLTLKKGKTLTLKPVLTPKTAETKLTWSSSKPAVAKVSASGVVTALKKGTTTITVKTGNGKKFRVKIKVK